MALDLLIKNGTVVDGSGLPRYRADVGVRGGRIVEIGRIRAAAERVIDADGLIVAPGFIDGHTHMDAQVAWDPIGSCSCWHGVTSVVMGNCGFALAPCKPEDREWFARCLTAVEDIPTEAMLAGIEWNWETFPEYLANVERLPKALNYGMYIGHSALRMYAMGKRGLDETATEDDLRVDGARRRRGDPGRRAGLLDLARDDAYPPRWRPGRQPHRGLGGDRPSRRRDGRTRFRHLPDRPRHLRRRGAAGVSRPAAQGGARQRPPGYVRHAGDKAGGRAEPVGLPAALDRRDRRARRARLGPGDDPLDQRDLFAEIVSAVRLPAGLARAPRLAARRAEGAAARSGNAAASRCRRSEDEAERGGNAGRRRRDDRPAQTGLRQSVPDVRHGLGRSERRRAGAAAQPAPGRDDHRSVPGERRPRVRAAARQRERRRTCSAC